MSFTGSQQTARLKTTLGNDGGLISFLKKLTVIPYEDTVPSRTENISAVPISSVIVECNRR